jgi:hypothetical protein
MAYLPRDFHLDLAPLIACYTEETCWWCDQSRCPGHSENEELHIPSNLVMEMKRNDLSRVFADTLSSTRKLTMGNIHNDLKHFFKRWTPWDQKQKRIFARFGLDFDMRKKANGNATEMWLGCDPANLALMGGFSNGDLDLLVRALHSWMDYATFTRLFNLNFEIFIRARQNWLVWLDSLNKIDLQICVEWYSTVASATAS